jgi:hypothetical protein
VEVGQHDGAGERVRRRAPIQKQLFGVRVPVPDDHAPATRRRRPRLRGAAA